MGALVDEVMVSRMGGAKLSTQRVQALLDFIDVQRALPPPEGLDAAAVQRGYALFNSAAVGCASCHTGAQGTNNASAFVGTDEMVQVPRLTGLATRGPWFHDGRLKRLEERFDAVGGGEQHGSTAHLSTEQKRDLVEYLRSL